MIDTKVGGFHMKKKQYITALALLIAFAVWTAAVSLVDVQPIGPEGSAVGFAALNGWFHGLTGVHMALYELTDLLSIVPLALVAGFGLLGLVQWVRRKKLLAVDRSILALGGFYAAVLAAFVLFEVLEVNYRPVLIEGVLEASYPSSTTMLALCVLVTAMLQLRERMKSGALGSLVLAALVVFAAFLVVGRVISGVHWLSDIIGGMLLSAGLILAYDAASRE